MVWKWWKTMVVRKWLATLVSNHGIIHDSWGLTKHGFSPLMIRGMCGRCGPSDFRLYVCSSKIPLPGVLYILCWKIRYLRGSTNPYATEAPFFPLLLLPRNIAHVGNPGLHLGIELAQIPKNCGSEACEILLDSQFSQVVSRFFPRRLVEGETSLSILCCGDLCGQVDLLHSKLLELRWGQPAIPSDCVKPSRICPGWWDFHRGPMI